MLHQSNAMSSEAIEQELCKKLERVRLQKNTSQTKLAEAAGVSRRTISRMENGQGVSLDTFIRVMKALGLADHLVAMIPDAKIRPIERVNQKTERKNASSPRTPQSKKKWKWGDQS
ncbi:helix-turn-helix domain-containing protein [Mariniblastus sp.]|nr:helix-turn-helix domain-containing protein [Mariniblastus sp.]